MDLKREANVRVLKTRILCNGQKGVKILVENVYETCIYFSALMEHLEMCKLMQAFKLNTDNKLDNLS